MTDLVPTDRLLAALKGKRYFEYRFVKQVVQLYPQSTGEDLVRVHLFVSELINLVPGPTRVKAAERLIRHLVNDCPECPTVDQFRKAVAEVALAEQGETFASLFERAKLFIATPPTNPAIAERWLEKVIFTTVRKLGRDRFALATPQEWQQAATRTILRDDGGLLAFNVQQPQAPQTAKRDFQSLLRNHD